MAIEKFSTLKPSPGQGKRVLKSKLLTALGATGVLAPFPQNPEHILERKILLQTPFLNGASGGGSTIDPFVTNWSNRVVANGGAMPSQATIIAVNNFYNGLKADGIDGLIIWLTMFAPDSLIAALTPLFKVNGNDPAVNTGFLGTDLSTHGLKNTASAADYLETGVNPTTAFANNNDFGISHYSASEVAGQTNSGRMWAFDGGSSAGLYLDGNINVGAFSTWDIQVIPNPAGTTGAFEFNSMSRTGATKIDYYQANSIIGFTHPATSANASVARPNVTIPINVRNFNGVYAFTPVTTTYSLAVIHHGLTSAQTQALFNRAQTLRQAFGGGFS